MSGGRILVTGATGNVGSAVLAGLLDRGEAVAAALSGRHFQNGKDPGDRLFPAAGSGDIEARLFDFTDPATWGAALADVDRVFLMRPPHISNIKRDMEPFLDAVTRHGLVHLSFLSVQGAESNSIVPHHKVGQAIMTRDLPYSLFRPTFFMQNLTTTHLKEIREEHRIFVPAGDGKTNFVDARDIAEVIVTALCAPPDSSAAYTITGDAELTYHQIAERLSAHLPYSVEYEPARMIPFFRYHTKRGLKFGKVLVMYALYSVTRMGKAGTRTPELRELLDRAPRTLDEFIVDHEDLFLSNE